MWLEHALKSNENPLTMLKDVSSLIPLSSIPLLLLLFPTSQRLSFCIFSFTIPFQSPRGLIHLPLRRPLPFKHTAPPRFPLTCMPSCPEMPTPTSATWIMLTSLAPSPEINVVREREKIDLQISKLSTLVHKL